MKPGNKLYVMILAVMVLFVSGAAVPDDDVDPTGSGFRFSNMTQQGKIAGTGDEGGHGIAFIDVDNDGDLDIYITNTPGSTSSPAPNYLYINDGKGMFVNEAKSRGVEGGNDFGAHGVVFADVDADGDLDLFVANAGGSSGPGQNRLYINDGTGDFEDKTSVTDMSGLKLRTRGITVSDFTGDGLLDFVITNPVPDARGTPSGPLNINRLFRQKKSKSVRFGRINSNLLYTGFTQGITSGDIDGDGDFDIIESKRPGSNYQGATNTLWINDGKGNFTDMSDAVGATFSHDGNENYNSSSLGDIDNDGDLDIVTVAESKIRLFRNDGNLDFTEITAGSGLQGGGYTAAFGDFNHDGFIDIVLTDDALGHLLFQNKGDNTFRKIGGSGLLPPIHNDPRGIAVGDYDDDGDLDIVIVHKLNIAQLFRNERDNTGYLKFRLTSPNGELGAIGAKVWLYKAGRKFKSKHLVAFREVGSSTGYISQNSPEVHFGLKKRKQAVDVLILFTDGSEVQMTDIRPGRTVTVDYH